MRSASIRLRHRRRTGDRVRLCLGNARGGSDRRTSINYPAIAAWLVYSYDFSGGAVFEASPRIPPGRIVTFDGDGRRERDYCGFEAEVRPIDVADAAAELFRLVADKVARDAAWTRR